MPTETDGPFHAVFFCSFFMFFTYLNSRGMSDGPIFRKYWLRKMARVKKNVF